MREGASWIEPTAEPLTAGAPANGGSCVARHDGRVVFVRYALPGETVRAAGHRRTRILLARRSGRGARALRRTASTRCARSPGPTAPGAATWRSSTRPRCGGSRGRWWPTSWSASADTGGRCGGATAEPVGRRARRAGGPGCGWTVGADGRAGLSPLPQQRVGHRLRCAQLPRRHARRICRTSGVGAGDASACRASTTTAHGTWCGGRARTRRTRVVEGALRRCSAGRGAQLAGAGHGVLAGAPRRRGGVQRAGRRVVRRSRPGMTAWDLYGGAGCSPRRWRRLSGSRAASSASTRRAAASRRARAALADLPQVRLLTESVRRALAAQRGRRRRRRPRPAARGRRP